jgi:phosphatidylserine/phosphatidylglycerophosphate/cardiolipin synthase-like enzyme
MTKKFLCFLIFFMSCNLLPCQGMDTEEGRGFKRKYQPTYAPQDRQEPLPKKARVEQKKEKVESKLEPASTIGRLSTPQSHKRYLQQAISSATKSILITSHGVEREAFEDGDLYSLLRAARERDVKVYIYNIDSKDIDGKTSRFFQKHDIAYDVTYTHAKLLAVDDKRVAIGSHNWLARPSFWENATLCLSGEECKELVPLLWKDLRYYRNLQFGNKKQVKQYEKDTENQERDPWKLSDGTSLNYLHSVGVHQGFIEAAFKSAVNTLIFCSPFINEKSGYQEDFKKTLLSKTLKRGVDVYFVCRTEDQNLPTFRNYLGSLLTSPFMHLLTVSDIHLKTVVVDDDTIAEGSFNWLSASRDEESEHHNHEVTFMLQGNGAKTFIQDFYKSPVGQEIVKATQIQNPQLPKAPAVQSNRQQNNRKGMNHPKANAKNDPHSQRRERWVALNWKVSAKGNTYINTSKEDGNGQSRNVVIFRKQNNSYFASIDGTPLNVWYPSELQAKQAAFDFIWGR